MDIDNISTDSGHRRRSSTSDATKFRERLQMLSRSVETQEHLVTESPREGELEEEGEDVRSGPSEQRGGAKRDDDINVDDISIINLEQAGSSSGGGGGSRSGEVRTESSSNTASNKGDLASTEVGKSTTEAWAGDGKGDKPGVLNVAAVAESDKSNESSSSETMPASVVNVGFDL